MYVPCPDDLMERAEQGWLYGQDAPHPLEIVDPIEGQEDSEVYVRRHPQMLALDHPELTSIVDRFQLGVIRELTPELYESLSHFEICCVLTMHAAHAREEQRRAKAGRDSGRED